MMMVMVTMMMIVGVGMRMVIMTMIMMMVMVMVILDIEDIDGFMVAHQAAPILMHTYIRTDIDMLNHST